MSDTYKTYKTTTHSRGIGLPGLLTVLKLVMLVALGIVLLCACAMAKS